MEAIAYLVHAKELVKLIRDYGEGVANFVEKALEELGLGSSLCVTVDDKLTMATVALSEVAAAAATGTKVIARPAKLGWESQNPAFVVAADGGAYVVVSDCVGHARIAYCFKEAKRPVPELQYFVEKLGLWQLEKIVALYEAAKKRLEKLIDTINRDRYARIFGEEGTWIEVDDDRKVEVEIGLKVGAKDLFTYALWIPDDCKLVRADAFGSIDNVIECKDGTEVYASCWAASPKKDKEVWDAGMWFACYAAAIARWER